MWAAIASLVISGAMMVYDYVVSQQNAASASQIEQAVQAITFSPGMDVATFISSCWMVVLFLGCAIWVLAEIATYRRRRSSVRRC